MLKENEIDALVLFSGGMDSTATLAYAVRNNARVAALTLQYGSLHNQRELEAARHVVEHFAEVEHIVQYLPDIFHGDHSALMGDSPIPDAEYSPDGPSITVVPFRNANLLSAATTIALVLGAKRLYAGMHASDHANWAYPDCSPEFLGAMANAIYVGTMHRVRLIYPFVWAKKSVIAESLYYMDVPQRVIAQTYSCYRGEAIHCGTCPTCRERKGAFEGAGIKDPTEYVK